MDNRNVMLTDEIIKFIELINCAIYGKPFSGIGLEQIPEIREYAEKNSIAALAYEGLKMWIGQNQEIDEQIVRWKQQAIFAMIAQMKKNNDLMQVISKFEDNNVNYAVFKGIILASLYPQDGIRYSGDSDIWVTSDDFELAGNLLESLGFTKDEENSKESVYNYRSSSLYIEMHKYLWEDYTGSKIDEIKKLGWTNQDSLVSVHYGKRSITTLGYTEQLEYMFFHTIKHYVYKGFGIRHLIDIALFVNNYEKEIDMNRFWRDMEHIGYATFCTTAFATCVRYLGMNAEIISNRKLPSDDFLERFILAAIDSGTFGDPLVRTTELDDFYDRKKNGNTRAVKMLFPSSREMKERYNFVNKCILLLPIAWAIRLINFAINPSLVNEKKEHLKGDELRQTLIEELELNK